MSKKKSILGLLAAIMILNTMLTLAQEENQQKGFVEKLIDSAHKVGIPLKLEEVYDPLVFFQSYGFTLILSLIALFAAIFAINKSFALIKPGTHALVKTEEQFKNLGKLIPSLKVPKMKSRKEKEEKIKEKEAEKKRNLQLKLKAREERIEHRRELMLKAKKQTFEVFHSLGIVKTAEEKRKEEARKKEQEEEKRQIQEEAKKKKVANYNQIKSQYRKLPKETGERVKLEVAVARKLLEEKDKFSVTDVLKKIDELYAGQLTRQDRIDLYEDIKRWTSHGELCQKVGEEKEVKYFRFV